MLPTPTAASPYPSSIVVSGMTGIVSDVVATVNGPDCGSPDVHHHHGHRFVPTNRQRRGRCRRRVPRARTGAGTDTTLGGAFAGTHPNGTWKLFAVDDTTGDVGSINAGWSITISTDDVAAATSTTLSSSANPSQNGDPVTFTATVTSAGAPVPSGTVTFTDGAVTLATVAVDATGTAMVTTSALNERLHPITATYNGTTDHLSSNDHLDQVVDNATTTPDADTWCNLGQIAVPAVGPATPYASHIIVSGAGTALTEFSIDLHGVAHAVPVDLDVMIVGPDGTSSMLSSDVGGLSAATGIDLTFSDDAVATIPASGPLVSGTFLPSDDDAAGADAAFPPPAPVSSNPDLGVFSGTDPNGVWSLFVLDDATGDAGSIAGGWCVNATTVAPTSTSITLSPNPSDLGSPVTVTATVTGQGTPVGVGTVQFSDGATPLGAPVSLDGTGTSTLITTVLAAGAHTVTATYSGSTGLAASSGSLTQIVGPVADAGGPYTVDEGAGLTLDATGSGAGPSATYTWDVNADGTFDDATGRRPSLTPAQLVGLGLGDGNGAPSVVSVRVADGGISRDATTTLTISNVAPTATITGPATATVGVPITLEVGAVDPSASDMANTFRYTIDWGDGTAIQALSGSADPPVQHIYAAAGSFTVTATATDHNGATSAPTTFVLTIAAASTTTTIPTVSTTTTATPSPPATTVYGGTLPATGSEPNGSLVIALLLTSSGVASVLLTRRRFGPRSPIS